LKSPTVGLFGLISILKAVKNLISCPRIFIIKEKPLSFSGHFCFWALHFAEDPRRAVLGGFPLRFPLRFAASWTSQKSMCCIDFYDNAPETLQGRSQYPFHMNVSGM
jgi:hypothetical protein